VPTRLTGKGYAHEIPFQAAVGEITEEIKGKLHEGGAKVRVFFV
jgi:hypothetical protein